MEEVATQQQQQQEKSDFFDFFVFDWASLLLSACGSPEAAGQPALWSGGREVRCSGSENYHNKESRSNFAG